MYEKSVTAGQYRNMSIGIEVMLVHLPNNQLTLVKDVMVPNGIIVFKLAQPLKLSVLNPISPLNSRSFLS
jgi:hypothetical protein